MTTFLFHVAGSPLLVGGEDEAVGFVVEIPPAPALITADVLPDWLPGSGKATFTRLIQLAIGAEVNILVPFSERMPTLQSLAGVSASIKRKPGVQIDSVSIADNRKDCIVRVTVNAVSRPDCIVGVLGTLGNGQIREINLQLRTHE